MMNPEEGVCCNRREVFVLPSQPVKMLGNIALLASI